MLAHGAWRDRLNAGTMLELSKTTYQADIDAVWETVDFMRANVANITGYRNYPRVVGETGGKDSMPRT